MIDNIISKKICMLGSFGVGKTSLVRRFVHDQFDEKYLSTIGVQISQKQVEISEQNKLHKYNFILWDIAHIEEVNEVINNYFRGSHGAIVVFDLTRPHTFQNSDLYLKPYLQINPNSQLLFVGNKYDVNNIVDKEADQIKEIATRYQSQFILTSAKTAYHVNSLFLDLASLFLRGESE